MWTSRPLAHQALLVALVCSLAACSGETSPTDPARPATEGPATGSGAPAVDAEPAQASGPRLPHVLLVSVDTLRADRLGCYGHVRDTSPWMDSLAARGVRVDDAHSQATLTLSSHASFLTSLYPFQLALVRSDGENTRQHTTRLRLADGVDTLAEVLSRAGYTSAAFTGGALVDPRFGFDQGFEHFEAAVGFDQSGLATSLPRLLSWLDTTLAEDGADETPLFLFLHTFDVHDPYRAPEPFDTAFTERSAMAFQEQEGVPPNVPSLTRSRPTPTPELVDEVGRLYDNGVRYVDEQLAGLERELAARGLWDDTLVVLVSDHGEELQEHGGWGHGPRVGGEVLHVPWILRLPGDAHAGTVVPGPVPLLDLAPTVADLLGLESPAMWRGRSLQPLIEGRPSPQLPTRVYADNQDATAAVSCVVRDGFKLVLDFTNRSQYLYDLSADPGERVNVAAEHEERTTEIRDGFLAWMAQLMNSSAEMAAVPMGEGSETHWEAQQEMLKELGYLK
jgi:arylsulfatase A-like enzyme